MVRQANILINTAEKTFHLFTSFYFYLFALFIILTTYIEFTALESNRLHQYLL